MTDSYLTLTQLVKMVDIPESSVKRYLNEHKQFLNFHTVHNRYRVDVSAVETLKTIRRLYGEGLKKEAVDDFLQGSGIPVTITVNEDNDGIDLININQDISDIKELLKAQLQQNHLLQKEITSLKEEINNHNSKIVKELQEDINSIKDNQEAEKEARESKEANKGFFSKFFK